MGFFPRAFMLIRPIKLPIYANYSVKFLQFLVLKKIDFRIFDFNPFRFAPNRKSINKCIDEVFPSEFWNVDGILGTHTEFAWGPFDPGLLNQHLVPKES